MEFREVSMKDWNEETKIRDRQLEQWERSVKIKRCHCGQAYSYGYYPVESDPGQCQYCRDAEGELIL
jgi:hypothetical protein